MKLTKGKITKLYSKKRQSRKRYKNTSPDSKNKTFRRRRSLDLNRHTLKRIPYGGAKLGDEITSGQQEDMVKEIDSDPVKAPKREQEQSSSPLGPDEIPSEPVKTIILPKGEEEIKDQEEEQDASLSGDQSTLPVEINKSSSFSNEKEITDQKEEQDASQPGDQSTLPVEINKANSSSNEKESNNFFIGKNFSYEQSNDFDSDNSTIAQAFKTLADYVANNIAAKIKSGLVSPLVNASQTQAESEILTTSQTLATSQSQPEVEESSQTIVNNSDQDT